MKSGAGALAGSDSGTGLATGVAGLMCARGFTISSVLTVLFVVLAVVMAFHGLGKAREARVAPESGAKESHDTVLVENGQSGPDGSRESMLRQLPGGIEQKMRDLLDTNDKHMQEIEEAVE